MRNLFNPLVFVLIASSLNCPGNSGNSSSAASTNASSGSLGSGTFIVIFDSQTAQTDANPNFKIVTAPATLVDALPSNPTRDHFTFGGWFTGKNGAGVEFTASHNVSANLTVYAKWDAQLTVKIGNLLWKKCAEGQTGGTCEGLATYYQYCTTDTISNCHNGTNLFAGPIYDACNGLNNTPPGGYAGKTNWRVPTMSDFNDTLSCTTGIDTTTTPGFWRCNPGSASPTAAQSLFPNLIPTIYWSSNYGGWSPTKFDYRQGLPVSTGNGSGDPYATPGQDPSGLPTGWHFLRCVADDP